MHSPPPAGCRPVACNYGGNKTRMRHRVSWQPLESASAYQQLHTCLPRTPRKYQEPILLCMCSFTALTMLLWSLFPPHSDSRYLPGSRTASAHHNALNCFQSDQQMTARGSSSCYRVCRAALVPPSRRKHLPNSSITRRAHTHHLLLGIWVAQAAQMSPDAKRHQRKAVS